MIDYRLCIEHQYYSCKCLPCGTCGRRTDYGRADGAGRCNGCHEVELRLRGYLRDGGEKARAFVLAALEEA